MEMKYLKKFSDKDIFQDCFVGTLTRPSDLFSKRFKQHGGTGRIPLGTSEVQRALLGGRYVSLRSSLPKVLCFSADASANLKLLWKRFLQRHHLVPYTMVVIWREWMGEEIGRLIEAEGHREYRVFLLQDMDLEKFIELDYDLKRLVYQRRFVKTLPHHSPRLSNGTFKRVRA